MCRWLAARRGGHRSRCRNASAGRWIGAGQHLADGCFDVVEFHARIPARPVRPAVCNRQDRLRKRRPYPVHQFLFAGDGNDRADPRLSHEFQRLAAAACQVAEDAVLVAQAQQPGDVALATTTAVIDIVNDIGLTIRLLQAMRHEQEQAAGVDISASMPRDPVVRAYKGLSPHSLPFARDRRSALLPAGGGPAPPCGTGPHRDSLTMEHTTKARAVNVNSLCLVRMIPITCGPRAGDRPALGGPEPGAMQTSATKHVVVVGTGRDGRPTISER